MSEKYIIKLLGREHSYVQCREVKLVKDTQRDVLSMGKRMRQVVEAK